MRESAHIIIIAILMIADMGVLYLGEEITINVRSFMELPKKSVHYQWGTVPRGTYEISPYLPSNMKLTHDGSTIVIKEHRSYKDMMLTCVVITNKKIAIGRRNFFLRKIGMDKLKFIIQNTI